MAELRYRNPVYPHYFADPFVLRVGSDYWAYGTAPPDERGRHFPILRSSDLVHWKYVAHALAPVTPYAHWAPEVAHHNGRFYLYYSASSSSSDDGHRLRVAVADTPAGAFCDAGYALMPEYGFSIDASPFHDPKSGKWWLFFAADFTEDEPYGTGLAVVQLTDDLMHVQGEPQLVMRAKCPWQVYERNRNYKGRVWPAWNTLEGPFVVCRDGKYWCFYSGGAWHTANYGMSVAVADDVRGPWRDDASAHGPTVLLATDQVPGPGHGCVTTAPGETQVLVYHAWDVDKTMRRMCIDPLEWTPEGPIGRGPSTEDKTITS